METGTSFQMLKNESYPESFVKRAGCPWPPHPGAGQPWRHVVSMLPPGRATFPSQVQFKGVLQECG